MRSCVALALALAFATMVVSPTSAQRRAPSVSSALDRVETSVSVEPAAPGPGEKVVLRVAIKPDREIRVFAPGAKNFTPVFVVLAPAKGLKAGKLSYSAAGSEKNPGNDKKVPAYSRQFEISYTAIIDKDAKPGTDLMVSGALTYQAFNSREVFAKRTTTIRWTLRVGVPSEVP